MKIEWGTRLVEPVSVTEILENCAGSIHHYFVRFALYFVWTLIACALSVAKYTNNPTLRILLNRYAINNI